LSFDRSMRERSESSGGSEEDEDWDERSGESCSARLVREEVSEWRESSILLLAFAGCYGVDDSEASLVLSKECIDAKEAEY
jgi:hypothetical protein